MTRSSLVWICEETINYAIKRLSRLGGKNQEAFESEFKEWVKSTHSDVKKIWNSLY